MGETTVIFNWLTNIYDKLIGKGKPFDYKQAKGKVWDLLTDTVNAVHNNKFKRTPERISKWIYNVRTKGRSRSSIHVHLKNFA